MSKTLFRQGRDSRKVQDSTLLEGFFNICTAEERSTTYLSSLPLAQEDKLDKLLLRD